MSPDSIAKSYAVPARVAELAISFGLAGACCEAADASAEPPRAFLAALRMLLATQVGPQRAERMLKGRR